MIYSTRDRIGRWRGRRGGGGRGLFVSMFVRVWVWTHWCVMSPCSPISRPVIPLWVTKFLLLLTFTWQVSQCEDGNQSGLPVQCVSWLLALFGVRRKLINIVSLFLSIFFFGSILHNFCEGCPVLPLSQLF